MVYTSVNLRKKRHIFPLQAGTLSAEKEMRVVPIQSPETERSTLHVVTEPQTNDGSIPCPCIFHRSPGCLYGDNSFRQSEHVAARSKCVARCAVTLLINPGQTHSDPYRVLRDPDEKQQWSCFCSVACERDFTLVCVQPGGL